MIRKHEVDWTFNKQSSGCGLRENLDDAEEHDMIEDTLDDIHDKLQDASVKDTYTREHGLKDIEEKMRVGQYAGDRVG